MEKFFGVVGALGMVVLPLGFLVSVCYNLAHPETWSDWHHDPRVYGPLWSVIFPPLLWMCVREHRKLRRMKKRIGRLNPMLDVVEGLSKSGRRRESQEAYRLYQRMKAARSEGEEDKLANQFSDMYRL
jgi:hypothetical protein